MKFYILLVICVLTITCQHSPNITSKAVINHKIQSLHVDSYSGYAFVFFSDSCRENCFIRYVKLVFIDQEDSADFKLDKIDVKNYISERLVIAAPLHYKIDVFRNSKHKYKVNFTSCNMDRTYHYYVKCWIDYSGYEESPKFKHRKLHPLDTCYQTAIVLKTSGKTRSDKLIKYKIVETAN